MEFKIKTGDLAKQKTPCLILGVFEKRKLSGPAEAIDKASGGRLGEVLKLGDLDGDDRMDLVISTNRVLNYPQGLGYVYLPSTRA